MPFPAAEAVDHELLERVGRGDVTALEELYRRYGAALLRQARRLLHDRIDAEDVVQDAFVSMCDRGDRYRRERGTVGAWLGTLVRNRSIDRLRRDQRRGRLERDLVSHEPRPASRDPEKDVIDAHEGAGVRSALASLPPAQRETLEEAFLEGMTYVEIAARRGVPLGTVKTRAKRGMASLRKAME